MENIWLYSLSALAQVMATIISLFAVFVIFRLSRIQEIIDKEREIILSRGLIEANYVYQNSPPKKCEKDYVGLSDMEFLEEFIIATSSLQN